MLPGKDGGPGTSCPHSPVSSAHRVTWAPKPHRREIWDCSGVVPTRHPSLQPQGAAWRLPQPREPLWDLLPAPSAVLPEGEAVTCRVGDSQNQPRFPKSAELPGIPSESQLQRRPLAARGCLSHPHALLRCRHCQTTAAPGAACETRLSLLRSRSDSSHAAASGFAGTARSR